VEQVQFHTPPGTSFLRVHNPLEFGDDLTQTRPFVVLANKEQKVVSGLEKAAGGYGLRGVVPVRWKDQLIGTVEVGLDSNDAFFNKALAASAVLSRLYAKTENGFAVVGSALGNTDAVDAERLTRALRGERLRFDRDVGGVHMAVMVAPLSNSQGDATAVIEVAMDASEFVAARAEATRTALAVGVLAMLLAMAMAVALARHLGARMGVVVAGVNRIAQGDLRAHSALQGGDEIADLDHAAQAMRQRLSELVADVADNAVKVLTAAEEITRAVEGQAATSSEMSSSVAEITSTMEELSASSTMIADHSKAVVQVAGVTLDGSRKGADAMELVLDRMNDISADNQKSLHEIVELGAKSKEIGKIMEIINTVADQTKLIAFNAALEASSAGEAGKRFSVVASEIRRLADSVSASTEEISSKINEIQGSISRLVLSSEKGASGIAAGSAASTTTAERLGDIIEAASEASTAAEQISLSTQQQKTASGQVVVALREIVTASSNTAKSVNRISQISKEMSGLSSRLDALVRQFQIDPQTRR
jgi:methyl-accepting chemotaxis protein